MPAFLLLLALLQAQYPPARKSATPPPDTSKTMAAAEAARQAGRIDEAIAAYRKVLKLAPRNPEPWWYLGMCLYEKDDYAEAETAFRNVTQLDRANGAAVAMLGLCEYRNNKYDDSLKHLLASKTAKEPLQPGSEMDSVLQFHLVALLNRAGQHSLASVILQQFVSDKRETPMLIEVAGINALMLTWLPGQIPPERRPTVESAGRALLYAWWGKPQEGRDLVAAILKQEPQLPNANFLMGYILLLMNDPAMLDYMKKELEISPRHIQARLQMAEEYMKLGEGDKGLVYAQQAAALAPRDFLALYMLGRLQLDQGNVPEAVKALEESVRLAPDSPQCHAALSNAYTRAGRDADAARERKIHADLLTAQSARQPKPAPPR